MRNLCILFAIALISCNGNRKNEIVTVTNSVTKQAVDTVPVAEATVTVPQKVYENNRFKDVTVKKIGNHQYTITGKAQVFEANLSWVIEDGHEELKKGFVTTDAGAPEWGNFKFTVDVEKKSENSTLNLIIFEASAMDGSRQFELPIVLDQIRCVILLFPNIKLSSLYCLSTSSR